MHRPLLSAALLALAALPAAAASLEEQSAALAARIREVTKDAPVRVGQFGPAGLPGSNFGPKIEEALREALAALDPDAIAADADFEVIGNYAFARSRDAGFDGRKVLKVKADVMTPEFESIVDIRLEMQIDATEQVAEAVGITGVITDRDAFGVPAGRTERNAELEDLAEKPTTDPRPADDPGVVTVVAPEPGSPLTVEVLAGPSPGRLAPRAVAVQDGQAYVDLATGEVCTLRVRNGSDREVAVAASVDGLSNFHFADASARDPRGNLTVGPHYVIAAGAELVIPGWFQRLAGPDNYRAFGVTVYGRGAGSGLGLPAEGRVGVFHVRFAHCRPRPANGGGRKGLGFGQEIEQGESLTVEQEAVPRDVDPPFAFVTIRYDRPR